MKKLQRAWQFLTTPLSKGDDAALRERMTRVVFVMVSAGVLLMSIIIPVFDFSIGEPSYTPTFIMLAIDAMMFIGWLLILRGFWIISRYLVIAIFLALGGYFVYIAGPITSGVLQFAIATLLTAMLLGSRAQWATVLVSEVLYILLGILSGEQDFEVFFTGGIVIGFSLSGIALLQWHVSDLLTSTYERLRQAEAVSRTAAEKMRAVFDSLSDGMTITDLQGNISDLNDSTLWLHGFEKREELIGRSAFDLIAVSDHPAAQKNLQRTLTEGRSGLLEYRLLRNNGEEFDGELNAVLIRDGAGQPAGFAALSRDITARKEAEAEREALIRQLQAKNTELEQFTYTVSHDLKSPLVTINGFLGYLEEDAAAGNAERLTHDIQRIRDAVGKMKVLLDELLELSRIGRLMNPPVTVPFADLVSEALAAVQGRLDQRRVLVTVQPDLPPVRGDRQRLVEVLQNLLDNAAKFMGDQPAPRIEVGCEEQEGQQIFYVRDNGMGIDPKYHEQVFGLFKQLNPSTEGTGIGLAIVKRIVEVHGGRIWVESELGAGATFYFTLNEKKED